MAFVAEDGTGLADANSLCDLEFADQYFTDRLTVAWVGSDLVKQGALVAATDYVEGRWSARFKGCRLTETQALSFPRTDIDADGSVPVGMKKAIAEYALRALKGPLAPDVAPESNGLTLTATKKKVGPIETEVRYNENRSAQLYRAYPSADALVRPFLRGTGRGVIRA